MPHDMYLHGGTIISGGLTTPAATIRIRDGVIDDVSHEPPPTGAQVIDTSGSLMIPGVINTHAHGLTTGPLFSSAAQPLTRDQALANADRHMSAGVTTVVNICGFAVPEDIPEHPLQVLLGTTNLPHALTAADLVDGSGLTEHDRHMAASQMIESGAVAIGEVGSGATLGGGVAAYRYVPNAVREGAGLELDTETATALIDALVGPLRTSEPDDRALAGTMEMRGLPSSAFAVVRAAILDFAAAPVVASLGSFAEATSLSAQTGVPVIFHTAEPSLREILHLARTTEARMVAGHMNHPSISPENAVAAARILREDGVTLDVSSLDIVHAQAMCSPDVADALASAGLVDTLTTDYASGAWEPLLGLAQRWIGLGHITLEQGVDMCTSAPADIFGFTDRGQITPGRKADIVVCSPDNLEDVSTVLIDGIVRNSRPS